MARVPRTVLKYLSNTLKDKVRQLGHAYCRGCLNCRKVNHWKTIAGPWAGMRTCDNGHSAGSFSSQPHVTPSNLFSPASVWLMVLFVGCFCQQAGGGGMAGSSALAGFFSHTNAEQLGGIFPMKLRHVFVSVCHAFFSK